MESEEDLNEHSWLMSFSFFLFRSFTKFFSLILFEIPWTFPTPQGFLKNSQTKTPLQFILTFICPFFIKLLWYIYIFIYMQTLLDLPSISLTACMVLFYLFAKYLLNTSSSCSLGSLTWFLAVTIYLSLWLLKCFSSSSPDFLIF